MGGLAGQTVMVGWFSRPDGHVGWSSRPDSVWGGLAGQTLILDSVSKRRECACPNLNSELQ